ncbi:MAG TPA: hypothetical protein VJN42_03730 [Candidatus Acidoferrum sp.]|nr:hypothetical protein [Candidatus Acidoferrum sp.]
MAKGAPSGNSSASKDLMWMMIALFTGLAILLGCGLFVAGRAVRSMGLSAASSMDAIKTPNGGFRVQKEAQVGPSLPVYPRASLVVPDDQAAAAMLKQAKQGIETSVYHTSDDRAYVDNWYKEHLSPEFTRHDAGDKPAPEIFADAGVSDVDIAFTAQREQMVRVIVLSLDAGGTKISLVRFNHASDAPAAAPEQTPTAPAASAEQPQAIPQ